MRRTLVLGYVVALACGWALLALSTAAFVGIEET